MPTRSRSTASGSTRPASTRSPRHRPATAWSRRSSKPANAEENRSWSFSHGYAVPNGPRTVWSAAAPLRGTPLARRETAFARILRRADDAPHRLSHPHGVDPRQALSAPRHLLGGTYRERRALAEPVRERPRLLHQGVVHDDLPDKTPLL